MARPDRLRSWPAGLGPALAVALAFGVGVALEIRSDALQNTAKAKEKLGAVADVKARMVATWRSERLADATWASGEAALATALERQTGPGAEAERVAVERRLAELIEVGPYRSARLLDADGRVVAAAGSTAALDGAARTSVARARATGVPFLSEMSLVGGEAVLYLVAPIRRGHAGALLIEVAVASSLFPLVEGWPEPSLTGEVYLVRIALEDVVYLSERRRRPGKLLEVRRFEGEMRSLAVPTLMRGEAAEVIDYGGARALAAIRQVEGTTWCIIAKLDVGEVAAPLRASTAESALAAAVASLAVGASIMVAARRRAAEARARAAEAKRALLEQRLELIGRHGNDAVLVHDERGTILEANDRALALLRVRREALLGREVRDFVAPEQLAEHDRSFARPFPPEGLRLPRRMRRLDGSTFPAEVSVRAFELEGRRLRHAILRDLTVEQEALDRLRESEERFRLLAARAPVGIFHTDASGDVTYVNEELAAMCGLSREEAIPRWRDVLHPEDAERVLDGLARAREGTSGFRTEHRFLAPDGRVTWVYGASQWLRDAAGEPTGAIGVTVDISDQQRLQARLAESERLAALGTLAAGTAHALNSPLAAVLTDSRFARDEAERIGAGPELLEALDDAIAAARRAASIVKNVQTFARGAEAAGLVDPAEAASAAADLLAHDLRHRARFERSLAAVPLVRADRNEIVQIVQNLLMNALEALPPGTPGEHAIRLATGTTPDGAAVIEVQDDGVGVPAELRPRIFDPFFTTRADRGGTGLGLSVVHGVASAAGGRVEVESTEGRGATFRVVLPAAAPPPRAIAPAMVSGRARILAVDDDELVLRAVSRLLSPLHEVTSVGSGEEALARLAAERFDAVLCDLMMPGMSGMDLQDALAARGDPAAGHTVFMTGGAFTLRAQAFLASSGRPTLAKPFTPDELLAAIEAALRPAATSC
jgi:PAS domain S-box-containing protein